jgi:replicative DNA helicase
MDQKPPHFAEAERAIIGSALLYGDRATMNAVGLRPDEFFLIEHREAWDAIRRAEARPGAIVDIVSVGAEVKLAGAEARFNEGFGSWAVETAKDACIP